MNKSTKPSPNLFFVWLAFAVSSLPASGQLAEEISVPEPTRLQIVASADSSDLVWSEVLGEIKSADASAAISAIEIEGLDGERVRGVEISLEDSTLSDKIYITDSLLASLRDELQQLETTRQHHGKCKAKYRCIYGIARCRPSQSETQAYCPGRFATPKSEEGFVLSTPRSSFSFPSIEPADFDALIGEAVKVFE